MSYYNAYELRYRTAFAAGATHWGHTPDDKWLNATLTEWVDKNNLRGKQVVEFACGEGACGVVLSKLGCRYIGFDTAPSAVVKASAALADFDTARVMLADCIKDDFVSLGMKADAGLDVMGLHMLVTDADRSAYLGNLAALLNKGAPALFLRESFREEEYDGSVDSIEEWVRINKLDLVTPEPRKISTETGEAEVMLPLLAARPRNLDGYTREFAAAGLEIQNFMPSEPNTQIIYSASFYTRKVR